MKALLKWDLNFLLILFLFTISVIFLLLLIIAWQLGRGEYLLSLPLIFRIQAKFSGAVMSSLSIFLFLTCLSKKSLPVSMHVFKWVSFLNVSLFNSSWQKDSIFSLTLLTPPKEEKLQPASVKRDILFLRSRKICGSYLSISSLVATTLPTHLSSSKKLLFKWRIFIIYL